MRHDRSQTKIIATLGPATSDICVLRQMFMEGIDVCRLNFSHGTHADHKKSIDNIVRLNREMNANVAILADLQGPKLRIGNMENGGAEIRDGQILTITTDECPGTAEKVYMSYREFPADVSSGDTILIDDGNIQLEVTGSNAKDTVKARVIHGGFLGSHKGVNLPDTRISLPSVTEKDKDDAYFALDHQVDWIALSFVRAVTDIIELKQLIKKKKKTARVIAKIEKPEALREIDQIIDVSDGIMVARGDLGVEISFDQVPLIQKEIVKKSIRMSKPVIIATQMMESMITNFRPTRAEANDVANAVLDGADALMLSGETSIGKYPVEVIRNMQKIIDCTEQETPVHLDHPPMEFSRTFLPDSICYNAYKLAKQSNAKAIITFTHSGYTAFKISSHRPRADIFAFTNNRDILRKLSLVWGVRAFYAETYSNIDDYIEHSLKRLEEPGHIKQDDIVIHVGSTPILARGKTNLIKIGIV